MSAIDVVVKISELHDCKIIYMTAYTDANRIGKTQKAKHLGFSISPLNLIS